jgi:diguanylate cyclase (GGDEF)-like protein
MDSINTASHMHSPGARAALDTAGQNSLTHAQLLACIEVGKAITAELDPDRLIATIMERVSRLLPSETWSLLLLDSETQTLHFEISIDLDPRMVKDIRLPLGRGVAGRAAQQQQLLVVADVSKCEFFDSTVDEASGHKTQSLICVPILFGGRTLGVLEVVNPKDMGAVSISLLTLLADYLAIAIENTQRYKQMKELSVRDNLTGLYNQRYLYQSLVELVSDARGSGQPISLLFMDMDNFKGVVDTVGHLNGSRALREAAQRIRRCLPEPGYGVAYGGDEFVIVLPGADRRQASELAARIRQAIKSEAYLAKWGHEVTITASIGVATFPDDAQDGKALLAIADQAMFRAKNSGKDSVLTCANLLAAPPV